MDASRLYQLYYLRYLFIYSYTYSHPRQRALPLP